MSGTDASTCESKLADSLSKLIELVNTLMAENRKLRDLGLSVPSPAWRGTTWSTGTATAQPLTGVLGTMDTDLTEGA